MTRQHLKTLLFPLLCGAGILTGCASSGKTMIEKEFSELHSEMQRLSADQSRMSDRLESLEKKKADAASSGAPAGSQAVPSGDKPPLRVVVLTPDGAQEPEETVEIDDGQPTAVTARGGKSDVGKKGNPERDYESAMKHVKNKNWDKVLDAMTGFMVRYPDSERAENAMFWAGEAMLQKGDNERALEQFAGVVARFPKGQKAPDALLKQALIHKKLGHADKAKEVLQQLKQKYPNSDAQKRAPAE